VAEEPWQEDAYTNHNAAGAITAKGKVVVATADGQAICFG
jgi:hypothetical protein